MGKTMKNLIDFMDIEEVRHDEYEDWTFAGKDTKYLTHGFHPYPARMIPLIAKRIIEKYATHIDDVILDPFCGSGTVLVEAVVHDKHAIGFDINPLAVLIAKTKTTPIDPKKLEEETRKLIKEIKEDKYNILNLSTYQIFIIGLNQKL